MNDDGPLYCALAAEHDRLDTEYAVARFGADVALWPYGTLRDQTRTSEPGIAMARVSRTLLGGGR